MPEGYIEYAEQSPVEHTIDGLSRTELNQAIANHLSALMVQRSSMIESRETINQQTNTTKEDSKYGRYIAWSIGAIATGGGIYLETIGQKKAGNAILVIDGLAFFSSVYSSIMGYIDRHRAIRKNSHL